MAKEQRIIFILSKTSDGQLKISQQLFPKMSKCKEDFEKLHPYQQEMQYMAAEISKFVMQRLAEMDKQHNAA